MLEPQTFYFVKQEPNKDVGLSGQPHCLGVEVKQGSSCRQDNVLRNCFEPRRVHKPVMSYRVQMFCSLNHSCHSSSLETNFKVVYPDICLREQTFLGLSKGVQSAARGPHTGQDGYECGPTRNHKFT